ncbi:RNA polymerase I enhancer binding protein [Sporothrix eucalyptigena]|uniref:RNA polymerase I enhancer binding protein n=1 Tax=Sporothrix eucalyptigena TaxID=1812306 RepID=A0ABP0CDR6_9PEZI
MADFAPPRIPEGMEGDFMLMPEQSKENSEKRKAWFREQADLEARTRSEKRRREAERESARQLALRERDLLNDFIVETQQQSGKQEISRVKKRKQSTSSASAVAGAEKAVVLPDKSPPPPSALSKAWSSLKKGTGRMLLTRKSTFDLRDMAEKMAPPPPPLSQRGDSNNTIDNSEDSDDSGIQDPENISHRKS